MERCYAGIVHEDPTGGVSVGSGKEAEELVLNLLSRRRQNSRLVRTGGQVLGAPDSPPIGSRRQDLSAEDAEKSVPASQLLLKQLAPTGEGPERPCARTSPAPVAQ